METSAAILNQYSSSKDTPVSIPNIENEREEEKKSKEVHVEEGWEDMYYTREHKVGDKGKVHGTGITAGLWQDNE